MGPYALNSVVIPMANSSMLVLPTITAPWLRSRSTTVASYGDTYPSSILEAHVVGIFAVQMLSFIDTGTPASRPGSPPERTVWSMRRASDIASGLTVMNMFRCEASRMRRITSRVISSADSFPDMTAPAMSAAEARGSN